MGIQSCGVCASPWDLQREVCFRGKDAHFRGELNENSLCRQLAATSTTSVSLVRSCYRLE
jgi:hypothetical protein